VSNIIWWVNLVRQQHQEKSKLISIYFDQEWERRCSCLKTRLKDGSPHQGPSAADSLPLG
jgi:hypothetical protein